jgi:hypothetical protein
MKKTKKKFIVATITLLLLGAFAFSGCEELYDYEDDDDDEYVLRPAEDIDNSEATEFEEIK